MELLEFVQIAMFTAVTKEIFGENIMPTNHTDMMDLMQHFFEYDAGFEYGAELPEIILR